ncbi:hypothetical protein R1flu_004124 [Riccia fluitans]|uniref:Uncharacterized protein n=1 Tax=Riccia fluitans TaxID=41844 RepID=A0ABD1YPE3_9MARC
MQTIPRSRRLGVFSWLQKQRTQKWGEQQDNSSCNQSRQLRKEPNCSWKYPSESCDVTTPSRNEAEKRRIWTLRMLLNSQPRLAGENRQRLEKLSFGPTSDGREICTRNLSANLRSVRFSKKNLLTPLRASRGLL